MKLSSKEAGQLNYKSFVNKLQKIHAISKNSSGYSLKQKLHKLIRNLY